ncbi:MAG: putative ABC transporter permease subunit [Saccharofermentanales bacterium]|jgi:ABC-2 type transport system permease protein
MKQYLILMRPLWSEMIGSITQSTGTTRSKKKKSAKQRSKAATFFLYLFLFAMFSSYSVMIGISLTKPLMIIGAEDLFIRIIAMAAPILAVIFGILQAIPTLYHESNIETLLVLPVKPAAITAAKLTQAFIPILLVTTILCYPSLIAHGIVSKRPWGFYVQSMPFMLYVTVAPFAVAAILVLVMMRYTKWARNKDRFQLITSIVTVVFIVAFSLFANLQTSDGGLSSGGIFSDPATGALLNNLVKIVPTSAFSAAMLIDANRWSTLLYGLIACALNVLSVVLLLAVADKIYLRGVLGIQGGQSAKQLTATETARKLTPRSAYRAILHKEWILLLRTPAFFTQTVFFVLFFPVIMVVSFAISFSRAPETTEKGFNLINFLRQWISSGAWQDSIWIIVLIVGGIAAFFSGTALLSASAISRQGATFNISKIIPVPLRTQVLAWLTPGFTLLTAIWIIITVALAIFLRMPLSLALLVFAVALINSYSMQLLGFWVDMKSPLLTWSNEIEAVKNTRAGTVSSLGDFAYIGISVGFAFLVRKLATGNNLVVGIAVIALYVLVAVILTFLVTRTARRLFQTVEL